MRIAFQNLPGSVSDVSYTRVHWTNEKQFLIGVNVFGIIGYILLLAVSNDAVKYFATYLCGIATYAGVGLNIAWLNVNVAPQYRRAMELGLQQTVGNIAGIVSGQVYRKPPYVLGNAFSMGSLVVAQVVIGVHALYLHGENSVKEKIESGEIEDTRRMRSGDAAVDFKYHY